MIALMSRVGPRVSGVGLDRGALELTMIQGDASDASGTHENLPLRRGGLRTGSLVTVRTGPLKVGPGATCSSTRTTLRTT